MSIHNRLDVSCANPPWRISVTPTSLSIDFKPSDPSSYAAIAESIDRLLAASKLDDLLARYVEPLSLLKQIAASVGVENRS